MRVRAFIAAGIIAALAGPALAQQAPVQRYGEKDKDKTWNQKELEKEAERAYKRSLGNIPEQKSADPWGTVRSDSAPKTVAKDPVAKDPATKRTKAGAAN